MISPLVFVLYILDLYCSNWIFPVMLLAYYLCLCLVILDISWINEVVISIKANSGYCARKMHFINFISYSAKSCHKCTDTTIGLYYH